MTNQTSDRPKWQTSYEDDVERRMRAAQAAGDEHEVSKLYALLMEQRQSREQAEQLWVTLNSIQRATLMHLEPKGPESVRVHGFFWGVVWAAAFWVFFTRLVNELMLFFSETIGLSTGLSLVLTIAIWLGSLILLFQRGTAGTTVVHFIIKWYRERT
jgi:hypothetical protein